MARDNDRLRKLRVLSRNFFAKSATFDIQHFFEKRKLKQFLTLTVRVVLCLVVVFVLIINFSQTKANSLTFAGEDITKGYVDYNKIDNISNGDIRLQKGDLGSWTNPDAPLDVPDTTYYPDMQYGPNNTIYVLVGSGTGHFMRYWIEERRWEDLAPLPFANFSRLTFDGTRYFYVTGTTGFNFYRYDSYTDIWEKLADTPNELASGANLEYVGRNGGEIYVLRGGNSGYFWKFSVATMSWVDLPAAIYSFTGATSMMWDHGQYIYMIRGNWSYTLYRFDLNNSKGDATAWANVGSSSTYIYDVTRTRIIYTGDAQKFYIMSYDAPAYTTMSQFYYDGVSKTWKFASVALPTTASESQTATWDGGTKFYAMMSPSTTQTQIRIYDLNTKVWDGGQMTMGDPNEYTAYAFDGTDNFYEMKGPSSFLYRKNIATGVGTYLSPPPSTFGGGGISPYPSAAYVASTNKIYVTKGNGYTNFICYDVSTNDWCAELATIPATLASGSTLVNGGDGYIYLTRGNGTTTFYRYKLSDNTWATIASAPVQFELGGSLVKVGNALYGFSGYENRNRVMKFDLSTQAWSEDPVGPTAIGWPYGGRVTSDGVSTVYLLPEAGYTDVSDFARFYSYNVTTKTWKRLANLPTYARGVSRPYMFFRSNEVYTAKGEFDNRIWKWSASATTYASTGTFYSKHYDLVQASSLDLFSYTKSIDGAATVYTRTSDNLATWDNWIALSGNNIVSLPKRYFQYKVVLTSGDGSTTPVVSGLSLQYSQETTAPTNPTEFKAYSQKGGPELTMAGNPRYQYHHPYFEWAGASDGVSGSGVDGYYVYYGTNDKANPVTDGSYQTTTNYTADVPMTAGDIDYLIMCTKDKLGNVSSATQMFSYRYWFVSPPSNVSIDSQAKFQEGIGTGVDLTTIPGNATLLHKTNGSWSDGDLAKIPQTFRGGAAAYAGGSIYVVMGNSTKFFYRYDLDANMWARVSDTLDASPTSSASSTAASILCYDGSDYLYLIVGGGSTAFERYSISRNLWTPLSALPTPAGPESSMAKIKDGKFLMSLGYTAFNYIYDPVTDSIEENVPAPGNFTTASSLYYDGNDTVYALMENDWLRRFVISENRWYTIMQTPVYFADSQNVAFAGIGNDLYFYANRNTKNYTAWRYSITDNHFYSLPSPAMETSMSAYVVSDQARYIYIFQNTADTFRQDNIFVKYDTVTGRYTPDLYTPQRGYDYDRPTNNNILYGTEDSWPFYTSDWSSITSDGADRIYFKCYNMIGEYSISQRKVLKEAKVPYPNYGHIYFLTVSGNNYLYSTITSGSNRFMRMDLKTWEWQELATAPGNLSDLRSQNLIADNQGRLYVAQGGNAKNVYRYVPGTNTWSTLAVAPLAINDGLTMTYDSTSNGIYFTFSSASKAFYKYDIGTNTWGSALASFAAADIAPNYGSNTILNNGKIYLLKGGNTKKMSVYTISSNTWVDGLDAPTEAYRNAGFIKVNTDYALYYPGGAKSAVWRYNFPSNTNDFSAYGVYASKNFLIEGVFSYVDVESDVTLPANTSITLQTRSTTDGSNYSVWQDIAEQKIINNQKIVGHIASPTQQNLQVRAILQSYDSFSTPVLKNMKVNYYADTNPPNNPTTIKVYNNNSSSKTELTSNVWYNYPSPLIDWPEPGDSGGATDGLIGSNINGYYIYVGHDDTAIPKTAGVFVTGTEYNPTLTDPGMYDIFIQSVDGSGNVATDVYKAFLYKFDNQNPQKPSVITVDPAGYSRQNSFTFTWPAASDGNLSGIDVYCYKTGATDGIYATEQCQKDNKLENIPAAYQEGANILYVRTRDLANNYSDSTTEVTFYYNVGPPTPITNLSVATVGQNLYTFTWDLPLAFSGNADKLSYYYSINALPTDKNTTRVEARTIEKLPAATQAGTNIIYIAAKDEAGNIDWNQNASITFFSNTVAPGTPLNVTLADISNRASSRWGLAMTWDDPVNIGSGIDHYNVERSIDKLRFNQVAKIHTNSYIDTNVTEGTVYYYRIKSADVVDNQSGASSIVSGSPAGKFATPPTISAPDVTIGSSSVTIKWTTDRVATGYINYGSVYNKLFDSKGSIELTTDHTITITGLQPNAVYYYELQSFDMDHDYNLAQSYSILRTFKTKQSAVIQNVKVSGITINKATIEWNAPGATKYKVVYGNTINYGMSVEGATTGDDQKIDLTGLDDTSTYHFKIDSTTSDGDEIISDDYNFQTLSYPKVTNVEFQPIDGEVNTVDVTWKTNVKTTSAVSYQVDANIKEETDKNLVTDHKIRLTNLADNTQYRIYAKGSDEYGNNVVSDVQTWKTHMDTHGPTISNLKIEPILNSSNDKAQIIVSWETDELSTSAVDFGLMDQDRKFTGKTAMDANLTQRHTVIIPNLSPAQIYHLRPISSDRSGNVSYGEDTITTIGKKETTVVQVIVNVFQSVFGWLNFGKK